MFDQAESFVTADGRTIGSVMMEMKNITLRFGGVVAIKDISFDVREGEIRAIIGPNGAGKSSMLNVISGFYHPQEGEVWYKGARRPEMKPFEVARHRLIKQQNLGIRRQGAGQFNAFFQTIGQAADRCFADMLNFEKINDTLHNCAVFCLFTFGFSIPNRLA